MHSSFLNGHGKEALAVIEALGLPYENCVGVTFRLTAKEIATVTAEYYVPHETADKLNRIFKKYKLIEMNGGTQCQAKQPGDLTEYTTTEEIDK